MWCRTILTAVAISYVLCMLLWSGLQKEDLDLNTLEKLGRYNVNIDDMNNQQLRQECLVPHVTTEVQREALRTSTANERNENDVTVGIFPKLGILLAANFEDRTEVGNQAKINTVKDNFVPVPVADQAIPDIGNATRNLGNKGIIKIEYNIQNQPNVESVMNFWTKLTRYTKTVATTVSTTTVAPITTTTQTHTTKKITETETHNNGYVHSREMEYINRILAEYLASQTTSTTTQTISTKKVFPNYLPIKYWEISSKASVEEPNRVYEQKEINKINNFTENEMSRINEQSHSQSQRSEPKIGDSKSVKRNKTLGILQKILKMRNDLFNNGVIIPETESSSENIKALTNESKEQQEASGTLALFKLFQNMKLNKNNLKNDKLLKAETWKPVILNDEYTNKRINISSEGNKDSYHEQKFAMYDLFKTTTSKITTPERTKTYHADNRIEDYKKSKLHQNSFVEHKGSQFQAKQNKNLETTNNQLTGMPVDYNSLQQSENLQFYSGKTSITNQQPTIAKFARNQLFKMKNDTVNVDSDEIGQKPKGFNGKQFKKAKLFQSINRTHDSNKIKAIQEIINNFDRDVEQPTSDKETSSKPPETVDAVNISDVQTISSSIIKEIAEKVKQIVLKDIGGEVTTTVGTTLTTVAPTTTTTTTVPSSTLSTTIPTSGKQSTALPKVFTETNHVMQELMEMFKEFKAMKDTVKLANQQNTTIANNNMQNHPQWPVQPHPETPVSRNPYLIQNPTIFKPIQGNSNSRIVPVPISSRVAPLQIAPQFMLPFNAQPTKDYRSGAITIQTNSDEIAPLAIEISKPLKTMNQHIVVPTKRTVDKLTLERERDTMKHIEDNYRIPEGKYRVHGDKYRIPDDKYGILDDKYRISDDKYGILDDKYRIPEDKYRTPDDKYRIPDDKYRIPNDKYRIPDENINVRGKLELKSDFKSDLPKHDRFAEKHEFRDRYFKGRYQDREKPWYNHEYHEKVMENHPVRSRFPEMHYPGRLTHLEHSSRPRDLSNERGHNRPGFNEPVYQQNGMRPHPGEHGGSDYDRRPRYEATKFHEKLERIENWPRNAWKDFHSPSDSSNDEISARQQLPLVKVKQRTRYDDSHFTNFMKSQKKVTDMLEKLLANNIKNSGPHSVETP